MHSNFLNIFLFSAVVSVVVISACQKYRNTGEPVCIQISTETLQDKIKGGWAGQTIGVVYGAQTEFKFQGTTIQDYQPIKWGEGFVKYWWDKKPGLFDDIYNDLTFAEVFEKYGLDVSSDTIASHFAATEFHLAHANQVARYNLRNGMRTPLSGNWLNNPHADDIDFQIEADFIGLMTPGMPDKANELADKVGHIMTSGDGFYGGVYVANLYALAFVSNDVQFIVKEALKSIPEGTQFHSCISDVINWHRQHPDDWQWTWFELHKKWNKDVGCPKGVFLSFNIDAKINAAYVALALLYGQGSFSKTIDIATRCGQDSDCNPSTACGVLGVMLGYSNIPDFWLNPLREIESLDFKGTKMSLTKAYSLSMKHATECIQIAGGKIDSNTVSIPTKGANPVAFEQNFIHTNPVARERIDMTITDTFSFSFHGNGYILYGNLVKCTGIEKEYFNRIALKYGTEAFALAEMDDPYVAKLEVWIDNELDQRVRMPIKSTSRRLEPSWKYLLKEGNHQVKIKWVNPHPDYAVRINDLIIYSQNPPVSNLPAE
ncbi:MAG: ADP-ribosylglycohydrolase family protein [Bacteroidales bacterium]|nr:ADP-ribosylglycohydrolase family protein [Bacteroidales bacterium]